MSAPLDDKRESQDLQISVSPLSPVSQSHLAHNSHRRMLGLSTSHIPKQTILPAPEHPSSETLRCQKQENTESSTLTAQNSENGVSARLKRSISGIIIDALIDMLLLAVSIAFMTLAIGARSYDGERADEHQRVLGLLIKGTELGPTILPIVFATIVGRASKAILCWRLERGTTIGTLDLLSSSTSLSSIVLAQFTLRVFSFLSPVLVLIWVISPVGSQASLRLVSVVKQNTTTPSVFSYMQQNSSYGPMYASSDVESQMVIVNGIHQAAILSPATVKQSPRDLWGNVKTPVIESIEKITTPDKEGWLVVPKDNVEYASLLGTPVGNISSAATYVALDFETSYWILDCLDLRPTPWDGSMTGVSFPNGSSYTCEAPCLASDIEISQTFSSVDRDPFDTALPVRHISYSTWDNEAGESNISYSGRSSGYCEMRTTYVQLHIECQSNSTSPICETTRMRRSQLTTNPVSAYTWLDPVPNFLWFARWFTEATLGHDAESTTQDIYLLQPLDPLNFQNETAAYKVSREDYGTRLGQLLNTFWVASIGVSSVVQGLFAVSGDLNANGMGFRDFAGNAGISASTSGLSIVELASIQCDEVWMTLLLLASIVMIVGILLRVYLVLGLCRAPDFINGNISSLLRDNPFVYPRASMNYRSAHRAAHLAQSAKHLRVRLGDVFKSEYTGHLAIGLLDKETDVDPITKYRSFD